MGQNIKRIQENSTYPESGYPYLQLSGSDWFFR